MVNKRKLIGRRAFLLGLGTLAGAGAFTLADRLKYLNNPIQAIADPDREFAVVGDAALRERAAAKGMLYGAAGMYSALVSDSEFAKIFARECAIMSPPSELKWGAIRPRRERFNFTKPDWMVEFANKNQILFHGHTLVWHNSMPKWFKETVNKQNAKQEMLKHIATVAGHYAGKMHSWDVVNEAIAPQHGRSDGLRKTPWLEFLGPDYLELAFRAAAEADPKAILAYSEYGVDYDTPQAEARRKAVLNLLERLKSRGTPIHAFSVHGHLLWHDGRFNPTKFRNFLGDVASLGLKIMVTEMDVTDQKLPSDIVLRDRLVAKAYDEYLSVVLDEPAVSVVMTWGLSDRYTWLSKRRPRADGLPVRPLPLDTDLKRKLAWNAFARAFDRAPKRI